MKSTSLIVVNLNVDIEKEAEFNDFYHHKYIPKLLEKIPEIKWIRRYEEYNVLGTLRYYQRQFLTFYSSETEEALEAIHHDSEWKKWENSHLHNVEQALYTLCYEHPRQSPGGPFGNRPFFMVSVKVDPTRAKPFDDWYAENYLPQNLADVPTWVACRRYKGPKGKLQKYLTIYEAADSAGLTHSLELMRAPHRLSENASWNQWDAGKNPVIAWEDATSFTPIYTYPN